jgi:hypothetical protein
MVALRFPPSQRATMSGVMRMADQIGGAIAPMVVRGTRPPDKADRGRSGQPDKRFHPGKSRFHPKLFDKPVDNVLGNAENQLILALLPVQ